MSLKTSSSDKLFSKAIIKADLKNHWAWPVVAGVLMLFNMFIVLDSGSITNYFDRTIYSTEWLYMVERLLNEYIFTFFIVIVFSMLLAAKLFFYLDKVNSVSCMHGFPFTRKKLFFSHILSGGILVMIPSVIITVIMMIAGFVLPKSLLRVDVCLMFLAAYAIYAFIAFAITVFTMTVSGNVIVSLAYSACIVILPIWVTSYVEFMCETNLYGYVSGGLVEQVFENLYLIPALLFPWKFTIYIILALALLVASYFIYKVRPLENCEEVMAFRKLRWFFIVLAGFVLGMISYSFFSGMFDTESVLWMLPLGLVGTIVASMFARKSISLKGSLKYVVLYVLVAFIAEAGFEFDLFGYERFVPPASAVESVYVDYDGRSFYHYEYDTEMPDYRITDPEEIELARKLHKAYVSEKGNSYSYDRYDMYRNNYIIFEYHLKNGMKVSRRYNDLSAENFDEYLLPLLNTETMKASKYPVNDGVEKELLSITVYDNRIDIPATTYTQKAEVEKLYDAIKRDVERNSYTELYDSGALHITVDFYVPGTRTYDGSVPKTFKEKVDACGSFTVRINRNFTETLKVLEEIGYEVHNSEALEKIDRVSIGVTGYDKYIDINEEHTTKDIVGSMLGYYPEDSAAYERVENAITVTDKKDVEDFYKLCGTGFVDDINAQDAENYVDCTIIFFAENDEKGVDTNVFSTSTQLVVEKLPLHLQKYFR